MEDTINKSNHDSNNTVDSFEEKFKTVKFDIIKKVDVKMDEVADAHHCICDNFNQHIESLENTKINNVHKKQHDPDALKWHILKQDHKIHPGQGLKSNLKDIKLTSDEFTNLKPSLTPSI
eukprot:14256876-Ditylum_brightwellii.AAC.1